MKALITAIITTLAAFNVYALGSGSSWEGHRCFLPI